jgi:hypothetical protein
MARALARDPAQRFPSAAALSEAFMVATGALDSFHRPGVAVVRQPASVPDPNAATIASTVLPFSAPPAPPRSRGPLVVLVVVGMIALAGILTGVLLLLRR